MGPALEYLLGGGPLTGWQLRPGKRGIVAVVEITAVDAVVQSIPHHLVAPGPGALGFRDLADANVTLTTADLDKVLRMNNTAARTVNLPPAASCGGRFVTLVKDGTAAFAITLDADGAETIDGATTLATVSTANRDRKALMEARPLDLNRMVVHHGEQKEWYGA